MKSDPNMIEDLISIIQMGIEKAKAEGHDEYYGLFCKMKSMLSYKSSDPGRNRRKRLEAQLSVSRECIRLFRLWCARGDPPTGDELQQRMDELERIIGRLDTNVDPY